MPEFGLLVADTWHYAVIVYDTNGLDCSILLRATNPDDHMLLIRLNNSHFSLLEGVDAEKVQQFPFVPPQMQKCCNKKGNGCYNTKSVRRQKTKSLPNAADTVVVVNTSDDGIN